MKKAPAPQALATVVDGSLSESSGAHRAEQRERQGWPSQSLGSRLTAVNN